MSRGVEKMDYYYYYVLRSLILDMISKIGCSNNNVPIIYNCFCFLLNDKEDKRSEQNVTHGSDENYNSGGLNNDENYNRGGLNNGGLNNGGLNNDGLNNDDLNNDGVNNDINVTDIHIRPYNKLYLLYCFDKLLDYNDNIMSKYFKYLENRVIEILEKDNNENKKKSVKEKKKKKERNDICLDV
ncbi:conserved Plasmodium membrane protein, unknown function [Plasmodium sp. DRC-Itaito]|nr:conserved Plasmodium membrane protein, unknown function [Plasmodium sp. DRC-Itaito]